MPKSEKKLSKEFEKKLDLLIKRFNEQKGIIDFYIKREREWKKDKELHKKEIKSLLKEIKKSNDS